MICQECGKENDPDARFCVQCSHPLLLTCPSCSTQNAHDARFCKVCGAALDHDAAQAQADRLQSLKDTASKSLQTKWLKAEKE
ncbi:MAG: zinc ribbon domain-containing protein, partial [Anaerolineales bacterium]